MSKDLSIRVYIQKLEMKFSKEMPRIRNEVKVFEKKLKGGKLMLNPTVSPQFNG